MRSAPAVPPPTLDAPPAPPAPPAAPAALRAAGSHAPLRADVLAVERSGRTRPDVALITTYPLPGEPAQGVPGIPAYSAALARALAGAGAQVRVIAPREPGQPERSADGTVRVERRFAARAPRALADALAAAEATGARVVHLQHGLSPYGGAAGLAVLLWALRRAAANQLRTVVTLHHVVDPAAADPGTGFRGRGAVLRGALAAVQSAVSRVADAVVVHEVPSAERVPGAVVIPHGVDDLAPADRAASRALIGLDGRPTVLCYGAIAPHRGLEIALEAAARTHGAVTLVVADGGRRRLTAAADSYAVRLRDRYEGSGAVRFAGRVPAAEVGTWFDAVDLALFPSPLACPTSATLALALAHGTPFLLSGAAGTVGAPGLAMPDDPAALAAQLGWLVAEPRRVAALRRAVRSLAAGRSWPLVADRHLALYEDVSRTGAPARHLRAA